MYMNICNININVPDLEIGDFFKALRMEPILFIGLFSLSTALNLDDSCAPS